MWARKGRGSVRADTLCTRGGRAIGNREPTRRERDDASGAALPCRVGRKHARFRTPAHSLLLLVSAVRALVIGDLAGSSTPSRITPALLSKASLTRNRCLRAAATSYPTPRFLPRGSHSDPLFQPFKQPIPSLPPSAAVRTNPRAPHQTQPHHQSALQLAAAGGPTRSGLEREMLLMAAPEHQKRRRGRPLSADLLQNCDLPPPAKLFLGPFPTLQQRLESADQKGDGGNDSLLRALRLSQSRAREAEEKLAAAGASYGGLAALLLRDSAALSAHRRWVMMLEAENSALRGAGAGGAAGAEPGGGEGGARHGGVATAWWVALAVCVGIAGVGLALGNLLL